MSCGNLAHAFAAAPLMDKRLLKEGQAVNIGIVNAYNDMLSAISRWAPIPTSSRPPPALSAAPPRWPGACRPCAMASPRASRAWS